MRKNHRAAIAIAMLSLGLAGWAGAAAPDEVQRQMAQRAMQARQKLHQAQAAKAVQRENMMSEHMKMMKDMMVQMQSARPPASASPSERDEWMAEHQKLMGEMMDQMMAEHHMLMQATSSPGAVKEAPGQSAGTKDPHQH